MKNNIISRNVVNGRVLVSTVNLGGAFGFETMVFKCAPDGTVTIWKELDVRTYETAVEAIAGHEQMVRKWQLVGGKLTDKMNNI